jgi:hypothetical protein
MNRGKNTNALSKISVAVGNLNHKNFAEWCKKLQLGFMKNYSGVERNQ